MMRSRTFAAARFAIALWAIAISGCGANQASTPMVHLAQTAPGTTDLGVGVHPWIKQTGKFPVSWTQLAPKAPIGTYFPDIVEGSDSDQWFSDYNNTSLVRIVPHSLKMTAFNIGVAGYSMVVGSDKDFYVFSSSGIDIVTTAGAHTHYPYPSDDSHDKYAGEALGPDGNVWFVETQHIAQITPAGVITEYPYPSGDTANAFGHVAAGSDGKVWFTEYDKGIVGKIDPSTFAITEYTMPGSCSHPYAIAAGSDKNLWLNCDASRFGYITTSGVPTVVMANPWGMNYSTHFTTDAAGNIWFPAALENAMGEILIRQHGIVAYVPPPSYYSITTDEVNFGSDGNIWAATANDLIDVYIIQVISVSPKAIKFTANGQTKTATVSEPNTTAWTAKSLAPTVCSVVQGTSADTFTVTDVGAGTTTITFSDAIGNNIALGCTGV